jgi:ubiquinone biosynthesis protein
MSERSLAARIIGGPTGFVRLLRRLGPGFVEFGRFLAAHPDFLPGEFRDELLDSQEPRRPLPWSVVEQIIADEIKGSDSIFENIDPASISYGPMTQVHRAVTRDGRKVALKILRPEVMGHRTRDRRLVSLFARLLDWTGSNVVSSTRDLIEEWEAWQEAEADLNNELANLPLLADALAKDSCLSVPRAYPEFSSKRILTMEDLGGIPLADVITPSRRADQPLENYGFDAARLAANLLETSVQQMFSQHFYNASVHPGSVMVLPGNRITFLDFSHCESVDHATAQLHVRFLSGVFRTELPAIFRTLEELLDPTDSADIEGMRDDFVQESHQWLRGDSTQSPRRGTRTYGSPLSIWMLAVIHAARRNGFRPPHEMLAAYRTLISTEWMANRLDPGIHLQSAGLDYLADVQLDTALRIMEPKVQQNALSDLLTLGSSAPEHLRQILSDSVTGRLALNLTSTEHAHSGELRDRRSNMIAAAIASLVVAWLMGEQQVLPRIGSLSPVIVLGPILIALYVYILVQWRRLGR